MSASEPDPLVVHAPVQGTVVAVDVEVGDEVATGATLVVLELMKMEHVVAAPTGGTVLTVETVVGATVAQGEALIALAAVSSDEVTTGASADVDPAHVRGDLAEVLARHDRTRDDARPEAVAKRRETGQRTARENVADLFDPGSFVEYGALAIAAQRGRRSVEDLIARTPADGLIAGVGSVNAAQFGADAARVAVLVYDYTVLAGTQGMRNHAKADRILELAARERLPLVLFSEGGGGRPGDTDHGGFAGLHLTTFGLMGQLSALVPTVGIASGFCFAGNAALLGCCDVVIATANASIGMGGPAMIEGGGLGVHRPEDVGPLAVQVANGVVDLAVGDEADAVAAAKRYLSYFQGRIERWDCADQRRLRHVVPEQRLRAYDVRRAIELLADSGSVLELRRGFAHGMVTALARIEGRPVGLIANNPTHLAGAIDAPGADKAARFMQLCDAFDLPIVTLCDTPGIMVGPEVEQTALVRHAARMFVTAANVSVPIVTVVLRKAYGLGAMAMAGGGFHAPVLSVAWPTGEFGPMGLEGAVRLGYRRELEAIADPAERQTRFDAMVAALYEEGKALNVATYFEFDDVIDPADTRDLITRALRMAGTPAPRTTRKRPNVDTW